MRSSNAVTAWVWSVVCLVTAAGAKAGTSYIVKDLYQVNAQKPPAGYLEAVPGNDVAGGQLVGEALYKGPSYNEFHAILWTAAGTPIDMTPTGVSGFNSSSVSDLIATDGFQQVGDVGSGFDNNTHAFVWSGTPSSAVDLYPTLLQGITSSMALGVGGGEQVGFGTGPATSVGGEAQDHALVWKGTAGSAVDLNPPISLGFTNTEGVGTDGHQQVGFGSNIQAQTINHALLWNGTAASAIDLNPTNLTGFSTSVAASVAGGQEVGFAYGSATTVGKTVYGHAILWTGAADTAVDLNPTNLPGFIASSANFTNGTVQLGTGEGSATTVNGRVYEHVLLWNGSADSALDLSNFLPAGLVNAEATSIDSSGDIFGVAYDSSGNTHVVEWVPQLPDPGGLLFVSGAFIILLRFRNDARIHRMPV